MTVGLLLIVIPAKAGIQDCKGKSLTLDARFRGHDGRDWAACPS
jgi:hypothetical protein